MSAGGRTHLHTNSTENKTNNNPTTQITANVEECGPCPVFASFTLAFALQLRKKHEKTSVRVRKTSVRLRKTCQVKKNLRKVKKNLSQVKENLSQVKENLSQGKINLSQVKKNLSPSTVYILPKHPYITKSTQIHTL